MVRQLWHATFKLTVQSQKELAEYFGDIKNAAGVQPGSRRQFIQQRSILGAWILINPFGYIVGGSQSKLFTKYQTSHILVCSSIFQSNQTQAIEQR
jgi:hypothetical protein